MLLLLILLLLLFILIVFFVNEFILDFFEKPFNFELLLFVIDFSLLIHVGTLSCSFP